MTLYQALKAAGVELDSHESDLYAKVCPESTAIIKEAGPAHAEQFLSEIDGNPWYDIPFAFDPFWRKKCGEPELSIDAAAAILNYELRHSTWPRTTSDERLAEAITVLIEHQADTARRLDKALAENKEARDIQAAKDAGTVVCPYCGSTEFTHTEMVPQNRTQISNEGGRLVFDSGADRNYDGCEGCEIRCAACEKLIDTDDTEIDFE